MASSEQLEREAEATRARIAATLTELRARISPGQMLDEAIDYARDGNGADLVRNLGRQAADNPMPVALLGAGLAWLMLAQRKSRDGKAAQATKGDGSVATTEPASLSEPTDRTTAMASKIEKTTRRVTRNAEATTDKASEAATSAYERASDMMDRARETTTETYGRARDAMERSMSSAMQGTRGLTKFMQEEPLVVAGLGIALGALVGALLPATDIENRAMGEASDRLKSDAREAARDQWERGKDIAEDGWDEAKDAARRTWEDAKAEAEKSWEDTKRHAGDRADGHAGDVTGADTSLVPSEEEKKSRKRAANAQSSS
jgi:ElaB/YqjD/DUF883 family membrane-anchored ribosome-binding protein